METLRKRWWIPLIVTALLSLTILLLAPRYAAAQMATDAAGFIDEVADAGKNRTTAAGVADIAFAIAYFTLGLALIRDHFLTRVGAALVGLGAIADIIENVSVIAGARRGPAMTDGQMETIRQVGAVKWAFVLAGLVVHLTGLALARRSKNPSASTSAP